VKQKKYQGKMQKLCAEFKTLARYDEKGQYIEILVLS